MKTGTLVKLKKSSLRGRAHLSGSAGITLCELEIFGFVSRVYVLWPDRKDSFSSEWVDIDDLEIKGSSR